MIVAKVKCKCGAWVRIRTEPDVDNPNHEYNWCLHTHGNLGRRGCGRKLELERSGGQGARIIGKCDGESRPVDVDFEQ